MVRENMSERELMVRLSLIKYYEREDGFCYFKKDDYRNLSVFSGEKSIIAAFKFLESKGLIKNYTKNGFVSKYKILINGVKCYDFFLNKNLRLSWITLLYELSRHYDGRDWISAKYVCSLIHSYKTSTASNILSEIRKFINIEDTLNNLNEVRVDDSYLVDGYTKTDDGIFYGSYIVKKKCIHCGEENDDSFSFRNYNVCKKCSVKKSTLKFSSIESRLYTRSKDSARLREFEYNLTKEYIKDLLIKQDYKCAYSGLEFDLNTINCTPSIDRIDSSKGYVMGNVAIVRTDINKMKNNYSMDLFKKLVCAAADNFNRMEGACL